MRQIMKITAALLLASVGVASAMTSGAMSASKPIDANATLHNGARTSVPIFSARTRRHSDLILTTHEAHRVWNRLGGHADEHKPAGFHPHIGGKLRSAVTLHEFPRKLAGEIPAIAGMRYAKLEGKVVVVRRSDRKIEALIKAPS